MQEQLTTPVWVELTRTEGEMVAELMVQQLRGAGIPAYKWQEGVGGALGLNVGPLGTTHILVDAARYAEARALLELDEEVEDDLSGWAEGAGAAPPEAGAARPETGAGRPEAGAESVAEESADIFTRISRAMLGFIAVIFSPFGVLFALLMKLLPRENGVDLEDEEADGWPDAA